jgi:uncharacterized RDD family membrane protein YckC
VRPTEDTTDVVGARIGAQVVDLVIMFVQIVGIALLLAALTAPVPRDQVEGYAYLAAVTLPLYGGMLETYWNGQTVGKWLLDVKVVGRNGRPPSLGAALLRNLPAVVVFSWLTTAVALASIAMSDRNQRVFDDVADTYVVDASPAPTQPSRSTADGRENRTSL